MKLDGITLFLLYVIENSKIKTPLLPLLFYELNIVVFWDIELLFYMLDYEISFLFIL